MTFLNCLMRYLPRFPFSITEVERTIQFEISTPYNFQHVQHMGIDRVTGQLVVRTFYDDCFFYLILKMTFLL